MTSTSGVVFRVEPEPKYPPNPAHFSHHCPSRVGDLADAALASSTRFIELDATAWTTSTVRVIARNIAPSATFDLAAATLSVAVAKRRVP
jgi:hypothetical protein